MRACESARRGRAARLTGLLLALLVAAAPLAVADPARAAGDARWAVFPTPATGTTMPGAADRPYFYLESAPGRTLTDHVSLVNLTRQPRAFRLSATAPWLSLGTAALTVPPRTRADIPFSLAIPTTAEPGDHPGAIVAAETGASTAGQLSVPVYLHVTGRPVPALSVDDVAIQRSAPLVPGLGASRGTVHYTLTNHGNVTLHPSVEVTETGWLGSVYHRPPTSVGVALRPGQSVRLSLALPAPPQFDDVAVTVQASAGATGAEGQGAYLAVPWPVLGFVASSLAVLAVWLRLRARRRSRHRAGWRRSGRDQVGGAP